MRRPLLGLAVVLALAGTATESRAQFGNGQGLGGDPFSLYYGFFLPRQAALAAQPGPQATIDAASAARQSYAVTNRSGLYDPASPFGLDDLDADPGADARGGSARSTYRAPRLGGMTDRNGLNGSAPPMYFNRTAGYFPSTRPNRSPNRNVAVYSSRRGGGGGPLPSQGMNLPTGPR